MSPTVPPIYGFSTGRKGYIGDSGPATLRKALPANPSKNRATSMVAVFFATAQGINQMKKALKEKT